MNFSVSFILLNKFFWKRYLKIQKVKFETGELYSILFDANGLPMLHPNLFVTINHRNKSEASSTCFAVFERIKYLYEILDFLNIDIVHRCIKGDFLSKLEMGYLTKWAKCTVNTFRQHVAKKKPKNIISFTPKVNKLETARAVIVVDQEGDISPFTAYNRLTTFAEYISWLENELCFSIDSITRQFLKDQRPQRFDTGGEIENMDVNYKSLTSSQVIKVLDVVRPNSSDNPWNNESLRYRNQLIINTLNSLGCRRGELLKIRCQDIKKHPKNGRRYVTIRSQVDLIDTRLNRPEGKTLSRHVPMDKRLSDMYDNYLIHHRNNSTGSEFIPFLLVTHNHRISINQALSSASINKICREIAKVVGFRVHPHAFRYSWNDRFSEYADKRIAEGKVSEAKSESDRQKLMGWAENSKMAMKYSKRHDDKRAFDVGMELQEQGSTEIESIVGGYDEDINC